MLNKKAQGGTNLFFVAAVILLFVVGGLLGGAKLIPLFSAVPWWFWVIIGFGIFMSRRSK